MFLRDGDVQFGTRAQTKGAKTFARAVRSMVTAVTGNCGLLLRKRRLRLLVFARNWDISLLLSSGEKNCGKRNFYRHKNLNRRLGDEL